MIEPTLYRIDPDKWAEHFEQDLDDLAWYVEHGVLVPVEIHGRFTAEVFLQSLDVTANLIPGQYAIVYLGGSDE